MNGVNGCQVVCLLSCDNWDRLQPHPNPPELDKWKKMGGLVLYIKFGQL